MQSRSFFRPPNKQNIFFLVGWLFADLLLATTVIFLVSTQSFVKANYVPPTPTQPPPPPCLELHATSFSLNVDAFSLINGNGAAIANVEAQLRQRGDISGRRAGLVIAYGGVPTNSSGNTAVAVVNKVFAAMQDLGKQGFVFSGTIYHDPLLYLGFPYDYVYVEIYLFAPPGQCPT